MAIGPVSRWTQEVLARAREDLAALGDDARLSEAVLSERIGRSRAERVKALQREQGAPAPHRVADTAIGRPIAPVADDDLVISRWDRPAAAPTPAAHFQRVPIPEDAEAEEPIEELIARAEAQFAREKARAATLGPRQLRMPPGPYAIAHLGDPHLDDPGCDWPELRRTVRTIAATPGMYAANGGDSVNNWVGARLTELYAEQETTREQGWRLTKWLLGAVSWVYVIGGNHDKFGQGMRTLRHLADTCGATIGICAPDDIKLELVSPNGTTIRLHARHDFPGGSMWNDAHAMKRAAAFGDWPADVYCAFHRHTAVAHQEEFGGRMRTFLRARGFKRYDNYAREKGFVEQAHGTSITTVVDPECRHPGDRIKVYWDVEEAADHLVGLRRRRAA